MSTCSSSVHIPIHACHCRKHSPTIRTSRRFQCGTIKKRRNCVGLTAKGHKNSQSQFIVPSHRIETTRSQDCERHHTFVSTVSDFTSIGYNTKHSTSSTRAH